jgi:sialate O-acetylesterase
MRSRLVLFVALLFVGRPIRADVSLASLFNDHAVLQRDKPVPVWGTATAGEKVTVAFAGQSCTATAAADGRWIVFLAPLAASTQGVDLRVAGKNTLVVHDVVVGDVWLCAGESGMESPVSRGPNAEQEIAAARFPLIRHVAIEHRVAAEPADFVATSGWKSAMPENAGGFTAVGYFFAREIFLKLGVPVGVVHCAWSGTPIEAWLSPLALQQTPLAAEIEARWQRALAEASPEKIARYPGELAAWQKAEDLARSRRAKNPLPKPAAPATPESPERPTSIFNGMIHPLLPVALRGVLWYQGESNVLRAAEYRELFAAMISAWRTHLGQGELPFFWVNLPARRDDSGAAARDRARLREAQTHTLALPGTGQAVAIDLDDGAESRLAATRQEIGRRLALLAKHRVYSFITDDTGPTFLAVAREKNSLRVFFSHVHSGLVAHDKPPQSLEIAGADGVFQPAAGKIERDTLVVSSPAVQEPVAVRYGWSNAPEANLANGAGLPAAPFRSDNW